MPISDLITKGLQLVSGGGANPVGNIIGKAIGNYVLGRALGGKKAGNVLAASTLLGDPLSQLMFGKNSKQTEQLSPLMKGLGGVKTGSSGLPNIDATAKAAQAAQTAKNIAPVFEKGEGTLGYADFLVKAGLLDPKSGLTSALNTPVGEGVATMLATGLASKLFDKEEEPGRGTYEDRPFGGSKKTFTFGGKNIARAAEGGIIDGQYFPRRNGGIMPSEGSGTKDDVPAMLMAGEFVLTKDAVKGLGDGNSSKGIERAYNMMDNLERRA